MGKVETELQKKQASMYTQQMMNYQFDNKMNFNTAQKAIINQPIQRSVTYHQQQPQPQQNVYGMNQIQQTQTMYAQPQPQQVVYAQQPQQQPQRIAYDQYGRRII